MGKHRYVFLALTLASLVSLGAAEAQTPPAGQAAVPEGAGSRPAPGRVIGDVTGLDAGARQFTLKTPDGRAVTLGVNAQTVYRRVPLGETTLDRAVSITFGEIGLGDRVRVLFAQGAEPLMARTVLVISKTELTEKQGRDRAEWLRRGIVGRVAALDAGTKEITLLARTPEGDASVKIAAGGGANFRRYSPDSIRFGDARRSTFDEIKVGDQLRSLGNRSADGSRFEAEEIISGSFRTVGGTITSVNPQTGEIKINDLQSKQPLTIALNGDSLLRRLPRELVERLEAASTGSPGQGSAGGDLLNEIEKLPPLSVADLKPGDAVLVSCSQGGAPSRALGVVLAAGVESFIKKREQQRSGRGLNLELGLPGGVSP
jgi:hypothetical protein